MDPGAAALATVRIARGRTGVALAQAAMRQWAWRAAVALLRRLSGEVTVLGLDSSPGARHHPARQLRGRRPAGPEGGTGMSPQSGAPREGVPEARTTAETSRAPQGAPYLVPTFVAELRAGDEVLLFGAAREPATAVVQALLTYLERGGTGQQVNAIALESGGIVALSLSGKRETPALYDGGAVALVVRRDGRR